MRDGGGGGGGNREQNKKQQQLKSLGGERHTHIHTKERRARIMSTEGKACEDKYRETIRVRFYDYSIVDIIPPLSISA